MGLLANLFSPKAPEKPRLKNEVIFLMGNAKFEVKITGEEHYQAALEAICGRRTPSGVNRFETASSSWRTKNVHHRNSVPCRNPWENGRISLPGDGH